MHDVATLEHPGDLRGRAPVRDVVILDHLCERPSAMVLANHVLRNALFPLRPAAEERKRTANDISQSHSGRLYSRGVRGPAKAGRFAERTVAGRDDDGVDERVVIWIERKPGALWAVGRMVNPQHRETDAPRNDDYLWEGHELEDCLTNANATLEDDAVVSEDDGATAKVKPFRREELLGPLERLFFGR